jgi:hypothetical protein
LAVVGYYEAVQKLMGSRAAGVAVFVKQVGTRPFYERAMGVPLILHTRDRKGADPAEWPDDLRVREFPSIVAGAFE